MPEARKRGNTMVLHYRCHECVSRQVTSIHAHDSTINCHHAAGSVAKCLPLAERAVSRKLILEYFIRL